MNSFYRHDAVGLLESYESLQVSPVDVAKQTLSHVEQCQPRLNSYCFQNPRLLEEAQASERRWASNHPKGPLDGVPVVIKDNVLVEGMPCSWGNSELARRRVEHDELPVQRLRHAGAIIVGKANTPEFTVEGYTANATFGVSGNPFNHTLTPGGSSGAVAAAVASGQAVLGLGTDGGGSIRRPAAYCGLIGLKPGIGHIPRARGLPQLLLDFEVVGPLTRTVRDARLMTKVLSGFDRADPTSRLYPVVNYTQSMANESVTASHASSPKCPSQRILYVPLFGDHPCDSTVLKHTQQFADQLTDLGHHLEQGELPLNLQPMSAHWRTIAELGLSQFFKTDPNITAAASDRYQAMAANGDHVSANQLWEVLEFVRSLRIQASEFFSQWDMVLTPATACMPWVAGEPNPPTIDGQVVAPRGHAIYSGWVNAIGHPSIALPTQPSADGVPIGVQLTGDLASEALLLDLAEDHECQYGGFVWPE